MKTLRRSSLLRVVAFFGGSVAWSAVQAQEPDLNINIRTTVEIPVTKSLGPHPTFGLMPAVEVAAAEKLVRPVADQTLVAVHRMLQEKLETQGYVGVTGKTRPEILITIQYGRGYLPNPYTLGMTVSDGQASGGAAGGLEKGPTAGADKMTGETGRTVVLRGPMNYMRRRESGFEGKMQSANQEKLFFTIIAWNFASMQKGAKRVRYWTTTILVDDPDHRDLNQIHDQMIAAGAEFFNRKTDREEAEISTRIRDGRVEIGTPRVIADDPKK